MLRRKRDESSEKQAREGIAGQGDDFSLARKKAKTGRSDQGEERGYSAAARCQAAGFDTINSDLEMLSKATKQLAIHTVTTAARDGGGAAPRGTGHARADGGTGGAHDNTAEAKKTRAKAFLTTLASNFTTERQISDLNAHFHRLGHSQCQARDDLEAAERFIYERRCSGPHKYEDVQEDRAYAIACEHDYNEARIAISMQLNTLMPLQTSRRAKLYDFAGIKPDDDEELSLLPRWFWEEALPECEAASRQEREAKSDLEELERQQVDFFKTLDKCVGIGKTESRNLSSEECGSLHSQSTSVLAFALGKTEAYKKVRRSKDVLANFEKAIYGGETEKVLRRIGLLHLLPSTIDILPHHKKLSVLIKERESRYNTEHGEGMDYAHDEQASVGRNNCWEDSGYRADSSGQWSDPRDYYGYYPDDPFNEFPGPDGREGPQPDDDSLTHR